MVDANFRDQFFDKQIKEYLSNNKEEIRLIGKRHEIDINNTFLLTIIKWLNKEMLLGLVNKEIGAGVYKLSVFDIVLIRIIFGLYMVGIQGNTLEHYYSKFYDDVLVREKNLERLEYYIFRSFKEPVKAYFSIQNIDFFTDKEFVEYNKVSSLGEMIVIDINAIVKNILGEKFDGKSLSKDSLMETIITNLDKDDDLKKAVYSIVDDQDEYIKVSLEKKGGKFDLIRKEKLYDLNEKLVDLKNHYPNSRVYIDNSGGKTIKIVVEDKLKISDFDDKVLKRKDRNLKDK